MMFKPPVMLTEIGTDDEGSAWEAIKTCESILDQHPDDDSALETLAACYERTGDSARARTVLLRLAELLVTRQRWQEADQAVDRMLILNPTDDQAMELKHQVATKLDNTGDQADSGKRQDNRAGTSLDFDLNAELELAWVLLQHQMITQEQYEKAIDGLTESRMNPTSEATLALLHELASMERVDLDRILDFLAVHTNMPYLEVGKFEPDPELASTISLSQARRLGILPFAGVGPELMVALLNPVDTGLQQRIRKYLKRKLHFYFSSPGSFQEAVKKLEIANQVNRNKARNE